QLEHIHRYLAQIENRPAFKNALIKGRWSASTFQTYWAIAW
ncbi:glutathione S-transferase, partial [Acinetobacter baumannii]|nr:glutathione S-transferase [Acinetobacter baumannii]HCW4890402.1 glutathione S-transferase [Acinetobacter baumannii]